MDQSQQNIRVNLEDTKDILCEECEGNVYVQAFVMKRVSALISPTGEEVMLPVQTFQCAKCGHINEEFWQKHK